MPASERPACIHIAGNTMVPCLRAMVAKGFRVTHAGAVGMSAGRAEDWWQAEKDGRQFGASNPEELLGLIAMWEVRGDDWRLRDGEYEQFQYFAEGAPPSDPDGNTTDR